MPHEINRPTVNHHDVSLALDYWAVSEQWSRVRFSGYVSAETHIQYDHLTHSIGQCTSIHAFEKLNQLGEGSKNTLQEVTTKSILLTRP